MKNSEIRDLTNKEIEEKIQEERAQLTRLRINHKVTDLENPHVIRETKRVIAKLKTEKRKRELADNTAKQ